MEKLKLNGLPSFKIWHCSKMNGKTSTSCSWSKVPHIQKIDFGLRPSTATFQEKPNFKKGRRTESRNQVLPQASLTICRCGGVRMLQPLFVYSPSVRSTQLSSASGRGTEIPMAFRIPYVLTISPGVTCCASSFRLLVTLSARKEKRLYLYTLYAVVDTAQVS